MDSSRGRGWRSMMLTCKHGHVLGGDNLIMQEVSGRSKLRRACRECLRRRNREYYRRRKGAA